MNMQKWIGASLFCMVATSTYAWQFKVRNDRDDGVYVKLIFARTKKAHPVKFVPPKTTVDFGFFGKSIVGTADRGGLCLSAVAVKEKQGTKWKLLRLRGEAATIAGASLGLLAPMVFCRNATIVLPRYHKNHYEMEYPQ